MSAKPKQKKQRGRKAAAPVAPTAAQLKKRARESKLKGSVPAPKVSMPQRVRQASRVQASRVSPDRQMTSAQINNAFQAQMQQAQAASFDMHSHAFPTMPPHHPQDPHFSAAAQAAQATTTTAKPTHGPGSNLPNSKNYTPTYEDLAVIRNFKRFKRKGSSSKYKGVFYVKKEKKWRAQICLKGKKQYIGTFTNDRDAAIARDKRVRKLFGECKELLNFAPTPGMAAASALNTPAPPQGYQMPGYDHKTAQARAAMSAQQFQFPPHAAQSARHPEGLAGSRAHAAARQGRNENIASSMFIKPGTMPKHHGQIDTSHLRLPQVGLAEGSYPMHPRMPPVQHAYPPRGARQRMNINMNDADHNAQAAAASAYVNVQSYDGNNYLLDPVADYNSYTVAS